MLPADRQMRAARTHSRMWDGAEYGTAVQRFRRRANWFDRAGWIASAALLALTAWLVWG